MKKLIVGFAFLVSIMASGAQIIEFIEERPNLFSSIYDWVMVDRVDSSPPPEKDNEYCKYFPDDADCSK